MNRRITALAAWTTLTAVLLIAGASASASEPAADYPGDSASSITWAIAPTTPEGSDDRVSLRFELAPGASAADAVTVTNYSDRDAVFRVYASDGLLTDGGDFDLLPSGTRPVDAGSWVQLTPGEGMTASEQGGLSVPLAALASATIPLEISVPDDAAPGDHPAGIVAELEPDPASTVQFASRVGVRIHLRVTGDIVAEVTADDVTAQWNPSWNPLAPGEVAVSFTTRNAGNVRVGTSSVVSMTGPWGSIPVSATTTAREVLPGGEAQATVQLPMWPLLLGFGEIVVTPSTVGDDEVAPVVEAARVPFVAWTVPWSQLAVVALAAAVALAIVIGRRKAQDRERAAIEQAVQSARAEFDAAAASVDAG